MEHVLITGGNKGIGLETTKLFFKNGYKVTVIARDMSLIKNLENCFGIEFNLENIREIPELISKIGDIDILVNNAGIMNTCKYNHYPNDKKNNIIKINLEAPIELMTCVSEGMQKKGKGRIVNNTSIAGHIGHPDIWYGITKAGLINATKSFALLLGSKGILVNAVAAGIVETDMKNNILEERQKKILESVISKRFAKPIEIAETIFWLSTVSPEYINGVCIDINNGAFLR
ncbi:SDR family oxidoreductase [Dysgonomonas sp. Marseille-P4677]|uniref:SDR family oxidoreductase n=1 Tax=Dysgonomonas sp. Marseille-P4677 TaxID=2364790 RepID=UPI0019145EE8|nr:SDR family oxidoreductase [Dysgonomonas sp. Marseille-P4677]MBK5722099.1 SDR family oxidoreductase [Dysgonomonas sp. Marseille-P4677]